MWERIATKAGDVIWVKIGQAFGRHEIAQHRFELWDSLPQELKAAKLARMR